MDVDLGVDLDVVAPLIVAALVSRNDAVRVINARERVVGGTNRSSSDP